MREAERDWQGRPGHDERQRATPDCSPHRKFRIAHLSFQPVENDARVERARGALIEAGFECPLVAPGYGLHVPFMTWRHKAAVATLYSASARMGYAAARIAFFSFAHHRQALRVLTGLQPDAIHAHDWDAAVVAAAAAGLLGVPFAYDAHEFAAEMHAERRGWRLAVAPLIRALEGPSAQQAAFVISVGEALGETIRRNLRLNQAPITIRNIPDREPLCALDHRANRSDDEFLLHYHGILARGRGLETALAAMEHLPARFRLRLTGIWRQPAFEREVKTILASQPFGGRVELAPPLPHAALVDHAAEADIGLCLLSGTTPHDRAALPNKVFEYLYAGLSVVESGSDEVASIIKAAECGASVPPDDPKSLARLLASWNREKVNGMRRAALLAAQTFNWNLEKRRLAAAWRTVLERSSGSALNILASAEE